MHPIITQNPRKRGKKVNWRFIFKQECKVEWLSAEWRTGEQKYWVSRLIVRVCFQGKKDVCQIFNNILRRQIGTRSPTVEYFCSHHEVLFILLKGWDRHNTQCVLTLHSCTVSWLPKRRLESSLSVQRYEIPQVALNCGIMLRECIRHEPLARIVLHSKHFSSFFNYVEMSTFDIASDAFATFKVSLVSLFWFLW